MNVLVEQADIHDAAEISALLRSSIRELCGPDYVDVPEFVNSWLANKTADNLEAWIAHRSNAFLVVRSPAAEILAAGCIGRNGEILLCYVKPIAKGTGVGKLLLSNLLDMAERWGIAVVTAYSTRTAKAFYLSQGFLDTGDVELYDQVSVEYSLTATVAAKTTKSN